MKKSIEHSFNNVLQNEPLILSFMQRELVQEITQVYSGEYESYKYANTKSIYVIALSFITTRHGS